VRRGRIPGRGLFSGSWRIRELDVELGQAGHPTVTKIPKGVFTFEGRWSRAGVPIVRHQHTVIETSPVDVGLRLTQVSSTASNVAGLQQHP
jgi:hypothetical protein